MESINTTKTLYCLLILSISLVNYGYCEMESCTGVNKLYSIVPSTEYLGGTCCIHGLKNSGSVKSVTVLIDNDFQETTGTDGIDSPIKWTIRAQAWARPDPINVDNNKPVDQKGDSDIATPGPKPWSFRSLALELYYIRSLRGGNVHF